MIGEVFKSFRSAHAWMRRSHIYLVLPLLRHMFGFYIGGLPVRAPAGPSCRCLSEGPMVHYGCLASVWLPQSSSDYYAVAHHHQPVNACVNKGDIFYGKASLRVMRRSLMSFHIITLRKKTVLFAAFHKRDNWFLDKWYISVYLMLLLLYHSFIMR